MSAAANHVDFAKLIAQAAAAEQAGVFASTRLDVSDVLIRPVTPTRWMRVYEKALVALPLAACVGVVIGVASMAGRPGSGGSGHLALLNTNGQAERAAAVCSYDRMAVCFAGPGQPISSECACADLDEDGDVDLLDVSSFQRLASATP